MSRRVTAPLMFYCLLLFLLTPLVHAQDAPPPPGMGAALLYPDPPYDGWPRDDIDEYGGWTGIKGTPTGFFHTEYVGNRWWLITPKGNGFFGIGIRDIPHDGSARRLKAWGFNCSYVGAEQPATANDGLPYMLNLKFIRLAKRPLPVRLMPGMPPWMTYFDVFDPEWVAACDRYAEERIKPYADDPRMVGFWIDNEPGLVGWYGAVTKTDPDSPARKAFVEVARIYYAGKPEQLAKDWEKQGAKTVDDLLTVQGDPPNVPGLSTAWEIAIAEQTFSTIDKAVRKVDPNHLNLGIRLTSAAPPPPHVWTVMGKYCDVLSLNLYSVAPDRILPQLFTITPLLHILTARPLMISEFSYRGGDTPCPNTLGAPPTVPTQSDRAVGYLSYVSSVASLPFFVGVNWYTYDDDNLDKRWDEYGEDCNFGVVDGKERPYAVLTEAMRATNTCIYELAADPVQDKECGIFWRTRMARWDKEWPRTFLRRFAHMDSPIPDPLAEALPVERRFHDNYWIQHESPSLVVNDDRVFGDAQANLIKKREGGHTLTLIGLRYFTSFPRSFWYGNRCSDPEETVGMEGNSQVFVRDVDDDGRVRRMTMVDGSFVTLNFSSREIRTNCKVPYLDLRYDHNAKSLAITTRGTVQNLGVLGVTGWQTTWNGQQVQPVDLAAPEGTSAFAFPAN